MIQQINNTQSNMSFGMSLKYSEKIKDYPQLKKAFVENNEFIEGFGRKFNLFFDVVKGDNKPSLSLTMTPLSKLGNNFLSRKLFESGGLISTVRSNLLSKPKADFKKELKDFIEFTSSPLEFKMLLLKNNEKLRGIKKQLFVKYSRNINKYPQLEKAFKENNVFIDGLGRKYNLFFDVVKGYKYKGLMSYYKDFKFKKGDNKSLLVLTMTPLNRLGNNPLSRTLLGLKGLKSTCGSNLLNQPKADLKQEVEDLLEFTISNFKWKLLSSKAKADVRNHNEELFTAVHELHKKIKTTGKK